MKPLDEEFRRASVILTEVARSNEALITLAQTLRANPEVVDVRRGLDCRAYDSGLTLEEYVEAELKTGKVICWWLEVLQKEGCCLIQASILVNGDAGQDVIKEFPEKEASSVDEFASTLQEMTRELVSNSSIHDLSP